jgi:hypothetical protein
MTGLYAGAILLIRAEVLLLIHSPPNLQLLKR